MNRRKLLLLGAAAMAWPLAARAHRKAMPVIGYLWTASAEAADDILPGFRQGLGEAGYVEGTNVSIEYRMADGSYDRLPALAADLVGRNVDLLMAISNPAALAARAATTAIPVVFVAGDDPVAMGLVASLSRPGGNLTGISFLLVELHPKRLELLIDLVPAAKLIALLVNPNNSQIASVVRDTQQAARAKGLRLLILKAGSESEIDAAFASLAGQHADAMILASDPFFASRRAQLVALAAHHAIPTVYQFAEFVTSGGLMSYGPSLAAISHESGVYAGKILKGAKPADLPVQQPTRFELVINLKTAKALGLTVSQSILARADEVIE